MCLLIAFCLQLKDTTNAKPRQVQKGLIMETQSEQDPQLYTEVVSSSGRQEAFIKAYRWLIRDITISDQAKILFFDMALYDWQGECYPSQMTLAADMGRTDRTIRRITGELCEAGLVDNQGRIKYRSNSYALADCSSPIRPLPDLTTPSAPTSQEQRGSIKHQPDENVRLNRMKMSDKVDVINKSLNPVCETFSSNSSETLPIGLESAPQEAEPISPHSAPPPFPIAPRDWELYQPVPPAAYTAPAKAKTKDAASFPRPATAKDAAATNLVVQEQDSQTTDTAKLIRPATSPDSQQPNQDGADLESDRRCCGQEAGTGSRKQGQGSLATPAAVAPTPAPSARNRSRVTDDDGQTAPIVTQPPAPPAAAAPELVKQIATMYQAAGVFEREAYALANKKPDAEYARRLIAQSLENWVKDRPAMIYFYGSRAELASRRDASGAANSKASNGKGRGKGKRSTSSASKNKNHAYTDASYHPEDYTTGPIDFSQYQETQAASDGPNQADYLDLNNTATAATNNSGQPFVDQAADQPPPPLTAEPAAPTSVPIEVWIKDGYVIRRAKVWEKYQPNQVVSNPYVSAAAPTSTPSQTIAVSTPNTPNTSDQAAPEETAGPYDRAIKQILRRLDPIARDWLWQTHAESDGTLLIKFSSNRQGQKANVETWLPHLTAFGIKRIEVQPLE